MVQRVKNLATKVAEVGFENPVLALLRNRTHSRKTSNFKFGSSGGLIYAGAGDAAAENLVVRRSSSKRATLRTISSVQRILTMSEGSSIIYEGGSAVPGREKQL